MIQVEPIQNFDGFGTGQSQSEYYYSQGMCRTQFGLTPNWNCIKETDSVTLSGLGLVHWFSCNATTVFGIDASGNVYSAPFFGSWAKAYTPLYSNHGNGMIVDQTNRVLVAGDRYLSKWDGSTANSSVGTVALNPGSSAVVGSGTAFTSAMVGKQITFFGTSETNVIYTVSAVADATHLTLGTNWGGSSIGNYNYTVYPGSTEEWKDFGSAFVNTGLRPMVIYEDWVVIGNGNAIALLNVTDDSFNNEGLDLPTGYTVAAMAPGQNGILVGVNTNNKGAIFLWDAVSNGSISEWIWFNGNIKAIVPTNDQLYYGFYVITSRGIYLTNGYTMKTVYELMPDDRINNSLILNNLQPNSVTLVGSSLVFLGGTGNFNRQRQGIYIFNTDRALFEFCPVSNGVQYNLTMGAVFYDSAYNLYASFTSLHPSANTIGRLLNSSPASAYLITEPKGTMAAKGTSPSNQKNAEAAKFTITESPKQTGTPANTYTLSLKVYNFQRPLWGFAQTTNVAADNALIVDGNSQNGNAIAQIGDEVTILEGVNAGLVAHITQIASQGTSAETWTLDTTFPAQTENGVNLSVTPFKLVRTFSFSSLAVLRDVYFDIASKYNGKRFLLKLLITNNSSSITWSELDITDGQFMYTDQGVITS